MSTGGFEKHQDIPGNLEGHAHVQGYVYAQERPNKTLNSTLTGLYKQEVKTKVQL